MAIGIKDLLKYKEEVELKDKKDQVVGTVWVRLLGDHDLDEAAKIARIASTRMRADLRNPESKSYQDQIEPMGELSREDLEKIILGSHENKFAQDAYVNINREELPEISEFAQEPDAPSLEEQESFDKTLADQQKEYEDKINSYIETRKAELQDDIAKKSLEEVLKDAQYEMSNILPLQTYFEEFTAQKVFRGTYEDKLCKVRSFDTVEDFKNAETTIKQQLIIAYTKLEINPSELKNS